MKKTLGSNLIWNSVGTLFYFGCQWLLTVFVVRLNSDYSNAGILTLAMSVATPLTVVAALNLRTFQVANVEERFSDGDFIFTRVITSILSIGICLLVVVCAGYSFYTSMCILLFTGYRLSEAVVDVLHGIDQRTWRLDIVGKSFLMRGVIMLTVFVIGEYFFNNLLVSITFMGLVVYGVIFCYDVPSSRKCTQMNMAVNTGNFLALIKIGIPLGLFSFLINLLSSIPRLFMEKWHGEDALGIFGSLTTITVLVPQLASFIFNPLVPVFADRWKSNHIKAFNKLLFISFASISLIGVIALAGGYYFGEWGLSLIFSDSIRSYSYLLCPIIVTAIITACIWLLGNVLTILGEYNALAWLSLVSVVACVAASLLLIPKSAFAGTILAMAIGLITECVFLSVKTVVVISKKLKR